MFKIGMHYIAFLHTNKICEIYMTLKVNAYKCDIVFFNPFNIKEYFFSNFIIVESFNM